MPRQIITEVDLVGDDSSDQFDDNLLKHLTEELEKAANNLSLRSVKDVRVTFCTAGLIVPRRESDASVVRLCDLIGKWTPTRPLLPSGIRKRPGRQSTPGAHPILSG
jgi:hypothetical protein